MKRNPTPVQPLPGAKVLVTGATGFAGQELTRRLVDAGCRVRVLARPSANRVPLEDLDLEWMSGQIYDRSLAEVATADVQYIFHLAAAYREAKLSLDDYRRIHVAGTRVLAEAVRRQSGFQRFVHVSTVGVHGDITLPPATEFAPFAPGDDYQLSKTEGEQWIRAFSDRTGLPLTVIRPTGIFGPNDRRLLKLFRMATWPAFPLLGFKPILYHLIHVEDLACAIMQASVSPAALNQVFIIGNLEPISLEAIGRILAAELNYPFRPIRLPAAPFFLAAGLCENVCRPFRMEPPLFRRRVAFYTKQRAFNTHKMRKVLGFTPRYDNETGLRATAWAYVNRGWLRARHSKPSEIMII